MEGIVSLLIIGHIGETKVRFSADPETIDFLFLLIEPFQSISEQSAGLARSPFNTAFGEEVRIKCGH